ncbi:hypothetical protein BH11PSE7_BH11PSE7_12240 [soil metagenome]
MDGDTESFDVEQNKQLVEKFWASTFQSSNRLIVAIRNFGFAGIEKLPAPGLEEMLITLQEISSVMDGLVLISEYDDVRLLLNAKQQIIFMEQLATAWRARNQEDFDAALEKLEKQAVH